MKYIANFARRMTDWGMFFGATSLIGMMVLTVSNIVYRLFGRVIQGSYELSQLLMAIIVGFALAYITFKQGNVVVRIVVSRFPKKVQAILQTFHSVIGVGLWGLTTWVTIDYLFKNGIAGEGYTDVLRIPYFPFKCVWVIALILLCLAFLTNLSKGSSNGVGK